MQGSEGAPDAWIVFDDNACEAARDLAVGDDVLVLTWLHEADRDIQAVHPRDDRSVPGRGVFSTRSPDRPKSQETGSKRRGEGISEKSLSVTVSIGACAPGKNARTPAQVVKAADEALYRAKQGGRNRVST